MVRVTAWLGLHRLLPFSWHLTSLSAGCAYVRLPSEFRIRRDVSEDGGGWGDALEESPLSALRADVDREFN